MRVRLKVWGKVALVALLLLGCIDDFDNPKGYGPPDGTGDTFGDEGLSCAELCQRSASCGGFDDDCREQCSELSQVSRRAGCTEDFEDVLDCLAELDNACEEQQACSQATFHFTLCIESYCRTNPSDCPF